MICPTRLFVQRRLIFDGAQIHNTQLYGNEMDYYTDEIYFNQLFPVLNIEGTVNLYVNEDSKIVAPADYSGSAIEVPGNLTIKDGAGCLTVTSDMYTKVETKAFYGCKNLRKVTFQTTTLSKKSVGKNAFGKINSRARYLIPSEKLKKYKRWLKKRGASKYQIFQKY